MSLEIDLNQAFKAISTAMVHQRGAASEDERGRRRIVIDLIKNNPELAELDIGMDRSTLLILAARFDDVEMLQILLDQGRSNPRALDCDQYSALIFAAAAEDEAVAMRMVKALAPHCKPESWNPKNCKDMTDVGTAILRGNVEVADFLIQTRGASADGALELDRFGRNWLDLAVEAKPQDKAVRWVLSLPQGKAMLRAKDSSGRSAMERAKESGAEAAVLLMMAQEALWEREELLSATDGPSVGKSPTSLRI